MPAFVRRKRGLGHLTSVHREDPLGGVANLFDASIVFAVGLMVALIQAFSLTQLLDPNSSFTIIRKDASGQMEIVEKDRKNVKVRKITPEQKSGPGKRLGIAYELPDGSVVYVPEGATPPADAK
ncbi:MAG: DUF2149 domain-containing protein [Vicinamibacterales bacterium]